MARFSRMQSDCFSEERKPTGRIYWRKARIPLEPSAYKARAWETLQSKRKNPTRMRSSLLEEKNKRKKTGESSWMFRNDSRLETLSSSIEIQSSYLGAASCITNYELQVKVAYVGPRIAATFTTAMKYSQQYIIHEAQRVITRWNSEQSYGLKYTR